MEWHIKTIDDISLVKGGKRLPKGYKLQTIPTSHPYITVSDFNEDGTIDTTKLKFISDDVFEKIKQYTISPDDLYISIAGTIGKTGYVSDDLEGANLTENACKLVLKAGVHKEFVYYFTKTNSFIEQAGLNTRVAAQPKLALSRLKTISIPIPPLPEQKCIVTILDEVFAGIGLAVKNAEKNLANARELFESYLNNVFTQKGDGWEEKRLEDVCELISGQHIDAKNYNTNGIGIGYLTGPSDFGAINPTVTKWSEYPKRIALKNDILVTVKGSGVGKINLLDIDEVAISRQLMGIRAEAVETKFLYFFMSIQFAYFQSLANGAAIPGISRVDVLGLKVSIPSQDEQFKVIKHIDKLQFDTKRLETIYQQKLTALNELKQSILQKAFTGELTQREENV